MGWMEYLRHLGMIIIIEFWTENQKGRDYSEDVGVCGKIILKWILRK